MRIERETLMTAHAQSPIRPLLKYAFNTHSGVVPIRVLATIQHTLIAIQSALFLFWSLDTYFSVAHQEPLHQSGRLHQNMCLRISAKFAAVILGLLQGGFTQIQSIQVNKGARLILRNTVCMRIGEYC